MIPTCRRTLLLLIGLLLAGCETTGQRPPSKPGPVNELANIHLRMGIEHLKQRNYDNAMEELNKALSMDPRDPSIHATLATLYERLDKLPLAEKHMEDAHRFGRNDSAIQNIYGSFLCQHGHYKEGLAIFDGVVKDPNYASPQIAYTNAGICAYDMGSKDKAEGYLQHALRVDPNVPQAVIQLAQIAYDKGRYGEAQGYLAHYHKIEGETPRGLYLGAKIATHLKNNEEAERLRATLRKNYPSSPEAIQSLRAEAK
jgi:type IV pilus assembly protein PilF